jgi:hypothetical protein
MQGIASCSNMRKLSTALALKKLGRNLKFGSSHQRRGGFEQFGVVLSPQKKRKGETDFLRGALEPHARSYGGQSTV